MHNDSNNPSDPAGEHRPFRFNARVAQFLALVLLALGLPLTVAVMGFLEIRKNRNIEPSESVVEPPGLRSALEQAVDAAWQELGTLGATNGKFVQSCMNGDECLQLGDEVRMTAERFGGGILAPERLESGGTRWIVQVPSPSARDFESALVAIGFREAAAAPRDPQASSFLYELEIHITK